MNTNTLRRAIADMFPHSYSRWSWRNLLADFVEVHLKALTVRWILYRKYGSDSSEEEPATSKILKEGTVELAKHQKLSYDFLAQSYFKQKYQIEALAEDNQELKQKLHKTSLSEVLPPLTPDFIATSEGQHVLNSLFVELTSITDDSVDKVAILEVFAAEQYRIHQEKVDEYMETYQEEDGEYVEPSLHIELTSAITLLTVYKGISFQQLAYEAYHYKIMYGKQIEATEMVEGVAGAFKRRADTERQTAEYWRQMALLKDNLNSRSN